MNFFLASLLIGSVTASLDVGPTSSTGAWAKPSVVCTAGETYSLAIAWGDMPGYAGTWSRSCGYQTHTYSSANNVWSVNMTVATWNAYGKPLPDVTVSAIVVLPRSLLVELIPGHGTLTVNILGGLPPYLVMVCSPSGMKSMETFGAFSLVGTGGCYVSVRGATKSAAAPGLVFYSGDSGGGTVMVFP